MRIAWDEVVVVLEEAAVDELMTFTTETVPPAEEVEVDCVEQ